MDSLYRTGWLTEENNNDTTSRQLTVLQQLSARTGCTILVVDHTAKGGGNERSAVDASRGASSKGGFFDFIFVLRATAQGPDPEATYVTLDPVLRDWPGIKELPLIAFRWTPLRCCVTLEGEVSKDDPNQLRSRILEALSSEVGGMSAGTLMSELDVKESTLRRTLKELVRAGKIIEAPDPSHKQRVVFCLPEVESNDPIR